MRRFKVSPYPYEMKPWNSVGDEVGSKDIDGVGDGILDGNAVGF